MVIEAPHKASASSRLGLSGAAFRAVIAVLPAAAITTWWAVGDLTFRPEYRQYRDYIWAQPAIPPVVENLIGALAALTLLTCAAVLVRATRRRAMDPRWWVVTYLLGITGAATAVIERVLSAGVIGAPIGGVLIIPLGLPVVAGLFLAVAVLAIRIAQTRRYG